MAEQMVVQKVALSADMKAVTTVAQMVDQMAAPMVALKVGRTVG